MWFYPSSGSGVVNRMVAYNYLDSSPERPVWTTGTLARTTWQDSAVFGKPHATEYDENAETDVDDKAPLLAGVGCIAGWSAGMLGLGGGLVMVPLMNGPMAISIHPAVRLSTVAVFCSATAASLQFVHEGRGEPLMGLLLGGVAALAARWTASRLDDFDAVVLVRLLRGLAIVLAIDSSRRAVQLLF